MSGIVYSTTLDNVTFASAGDVWEITTGASTCLRLLKWEITSSATAAEALRVTLNFATTAGTGGTGLTEVARNNNVTATTGVTAVRSSSGAATGLSIIEAYQWEQLGPVGEVFTPELTPVIGPSTSIVLVLATTPTSFELSGNIAWEEF